MESRCQPTLSAEFANVMMVPRKRFGRIHHIGAGSLIACFSLSRPAFQPEGGVRGVRRSQWLPARVCAHLDTPNRSTAEDALDLVRMDDDGLADGVTAGLMALGARRPGR